MCSLENLQITYHPQSGWFEDTPLKGGAEQGYPLKGVHKGTSRLRLRSMRRTTIELLVSSWYRMPTVHRSSRCAWAFAWLGKRGSAISRPSPTQRWNGRAFSSLTARGGGLPIGVIVNVLHA